MVRAASGGASDEEFGRIEVREVSEKVGCFREVDAVNELDA